MGIDVLVDPMTERLADIGFEPDGLEYFHARHPDRHRHARDR